MHVRKKKSLIDQAIDQASDYMDAARPAIESAVDQIVVLAADARDKAGPLLAEGRADGHREGRRWPPTSRRRRPPSAPSAPRTWRPPAATTPRPRSPRPRASPRSPRVRRSASCCSSAAILAVGGVVVSKLKSKSEADNWHSSYVPPSSSTGSTSPSSSTGTTTGSTRLAPGVGSGAVGADDPMAKLADDGGADRRPRWRVARRGAGRRSRGATPGHHARRPRRRGRARPEREPQQEELRLHRP